MDTAAFALARENRLRVIVGSIHAPSSVGRDPLRHVPLDARRAGRGAASFGGSPTPAAAS